MRISDWSSDVCSSDLDDEAQDRGPDEGGIFDRREMLRLSSRIGPGQEHQRDEGEEGRSDQRWHLRRGRQGRQHRRSDQEAGAHDEAHEESNLQRLRNQRLLAHKDDVVGIATRRGEYRERTADRKSVGEGKRGSVRVVTGSRRDLKKKKTK